MLTQSQGVIEYMLKVLYVSSEAVPFLPPGKIAEAAGLLPESLHEQGVDIRVVMPKYRSVESTYRKNMRHLYNGEVDVAWRRKYLGVQEYDYKNIPYYFIDNREYFYRDKCYGYNDDVERFAFFCKSVLEMLPHIDFWPDIIHLNDWQSALVSVYLKLDYCKRKDERYRKIKTVFTIHNLKDQGRFWKGYLTDVLGLDWKYFNNGDLEFYGDINLMKGAMIYSDKIVNLSHTHFGKGLEGILQKRAIDMCNIVEGIDYRSYDPGHDQYLPYKFKKHNILSARANNKEYLQKKLKLTINRNIPMIGLIAPLVKEEGIELVTKVIARLLEYEDVQFICIGSGDKRYENWFKQLEWCYPKKVSVSIEDVDDKEELIHQIYGSADILLLPSKYVQYSRKQLIALHYGAIPLVYGDSKIIESYDKYTKEGNGFKFNQYNAPDLLFTLKNAISSLVELNVHYCIVKNAMSQDYSWQNAAKQYRELYKNLKNQESNK